MLIPRSIHYLFVSLAKRILCNPQTTTRSTPSSSCSSPHVHAPLPMPDYLPRGSTMSQARREQKQTTSHSLAIHTRMNGRSEGYSRAPTSPSLPPSKTTPMSTLHVNSLFLPPHIHSTHRVILEETLAVNRPSDQLPFHLRNKKLKERRTARNREQNEQRCARREE